jgi:DNA-binding transcriptional MerR regulator
MRTQGLDVELLTIAEAAQRLGVSIDTIHRRLRRGQLSGHRQPTPQGFTWLVEIPVGPCNSKDGAPADAPVTAGDVQRLEQMVAVLQAQLEVKDKQIEQLHVLLQQAQAALPAPRDSRSWWQKLWRRG